MLAQYKLTLKTNLYVANYNLTTNALKTGFVMTKKAICGHHDFPKAHTIVFALSEDEFSGNSDGHWIVVAVDFSCYMYDSYNR